MAGAKAQEVFKESEELDTGSVCSSKWASRSEEDPDSFNDVEASLAEGDEEPPDAEGYEEYREELREDEVMEVLAVSWKDRRTQIAKANAAKDFGKVKELKRAFRAEVEELKKKTKCKECDQVGHWARECPRKTKGGKGAGKKSGKTKYSYYCQHENVCCQPMVEQLRAEDKQMSPKAAPGKGLVDCGCNKSVIGRETLAKYLPMLEKFGFKSKTSLPLF